MNKAYVSKKWIKIASPPEEIVEIDEEMPVLERIKLPIVREILNCGVRIEDMHEERYEEALEHIKSEYIEMEPMCKASNMLEDEEALEEFLKLVLYWLKDTQSLLAVDETSENLVGFIIVRTYIKRDMTSVYSRMSIHQGKALHKWQLLRHFMHKEHDLYSQYNTEEFACINVWYVHPDYQNKGNRKIILGRTLTKLSETIDNSASWDECCIMGSADVAIYFAITSSIGKALLRAVIEQTKLFKLQVLMGIFSSGISQAIAKKLNFVSLVEVPYASYVLNKQVVYADTGDNNCSANMMILHLPLADKHEEKQDSLTTSQTEEDV